MGAQDQRPRFYEGQYLGAEDLAAIVDYLRAADARHALGAHTWGIAIGLYLVERPAPGAADRREVILTPGAAWDGFGRSIVVTRPTRLPEELFSTILYEDNLDGANPAKGRAVRVWLNYREIAARQPAPGFESCGEDDQNARVAETFEFVVGAVPAGPNRQGNILVGTETLQAEDALRRFDSSAQPLYDASVPHQTFPTAKNPPRWLVPAGLVRWVARDGDLGYFASSEGVPDYRMKDCTRAFRRYIGAVVENLVAADGAIVLQRRDQDPKAHHKLAWLLACGRKSEELLDDLAWIEGNLRVVGNAKLAGGELLMRDADGDDEGAPIYLARTGDDPNLDKKTCCDDSGAVDAAALAKAPREFRAAIGAKGQNAHRFIVGPEVPPDATKGEKIPSLAPRLVVLSGTGETDDKDTEGRAGVNTRDPFAALEVKGDWQADKKEDGAIRVSGKQPTLRFEGGDDVDGMKWITQLTDSPKGAYRIAYRVPPAVVGTPPTWKGVVNVLKEKVGIRTDAPGAPLAVRADGDSEDLVSFENKAGGKKWLIRLKPDANTGLTFSEVSGTGSDARLFLKPGGDVGIGTTDPQGRLTVVGKVQPAQGQLSLFTGGADFEYDGGDDKLFVFKDTGGQTAFTGTKLGIGTTNPRSRLEVSGAADQAGTAMFVPDPAKGSWNSHVHWDATGDWYIRSASASGKVVIQDKGGNVGIGTGNPTQKLHVNGMFALVEGAGGEMAYIGGDASLTQAVGQQLQDFIDGWLTSINNLSFVDKVALFAVLGIGVVPIFAFAGLKALLDDPNMQGALHTVATQFGLPWPPPGPTFVTAKDVQIGSLAADVHMVHFWNASGTPGWMDVVCQSLVAVSDARLKTDIQPLTGALGTVCSLRGVSFEWRQDAAPAQPQARQRRPAMGVIAQEVAQVAPHMVREVRGSLGVSYNEFVPLLIEAVKELKAEVNELRAQVRESRKTTTKKTSGK